MKYPSILNRLIIGLIVILSALIFLSAIFIINFRKINSVNQQIINHPFTVSNAVKDINIRVNAMHRSMKDVALARNESQLNDAVLKVDGYEKEALKYFEVVKARYLGDKNDVELALKAFNDWKPIRQEVIGLSRQGKTNEAYEITIGKDAGQVDFLESKISVITDFAMNKADEFNKNSEAISQKIYNESIILLIFISVIIILSLGWIFMSVRNPLHKIISRINILSEKEPGKGSFPVTKNILETLHASVDNLELLKNKLEELVSQRTEELRDEKEFTELALNNQTDTFIVFDPETGKAIRWNKSFSDISGYSDDEIKKLNVPGSFHSEEDMKKAGEIAQEVIKRGIGTARMTLLTKNMESIPFEYIITTMNDNKTGKTYFVVIGRNITQRLKYELEFEQHRNHLQQLVDEQTEEIQATNEELKVANEELAALNEELAATNEELKTANEEHSVLNEELSATNEELEAKTDELAETNKKLTDTNKDLERFNELFVNREFRIKELKNKVKELENKRNKI